MPTDNLRDSTIFQLLQDAEQRDGLSPGEISVRAEAVVRDVTPILAQVCRSFPEYTLHDPGHSIRVLQNTASITPKDVLQRLNSIELSMLIYCSFLHDIGMAAPQSELLEWLDSDAGQAFISSNSKWSDLLQKFEGSSSDTARRRVQDMAFTDYLRQHHADRSTTFITRYFGPTGTSDNKIAVREVNYADYVALVCQSHVQDPSCLKQQLYRRNALVCNYPLDLQYLAILLRLADICDLDPERTPRVVFDFIDPLDPQSAHEWHKHRSIKGWDIKDSLIRFDAKCSHPALQRGLCQCMENIEKERRDCLEILRDNPANITERYWLNINNPVQTETIVSDGSYIYTNFRFELEYEKIISLLMGTNLWQNRDVALRELLQNSLDTCRLRQAASDRLGLPYKPEISFVRSKSKDGIHEIGCEDNGMGMDQRIIEEYFVRIGRSYYQSPEFRKLKLPFTPISEFGLGIMSCFMLTNRIVVETLALSEDLTHLGAPFRVEIDGPHRYFVLRSGSRKKPGTSITLEVLPKNLTADLADSIRGIAPHPPFDIIIRDDCARYNENRQASIRDTGHHLPDNTLELLSKHPCVRPDTTIARLARYDFHLTYAETAGLQGQITMIFLRNFHGKLTWQCRKGSVTFAIESGGIEYRKWKPEGGIEERGTVQVSAWGHHWSQDGIRVNGALPIGTGSYDPTWPSLHTVIMPIPCFLDVDLQGPWKLALDVPRHSCDTSDPRFDDFRSRFYSLAATLIGRVLKEEGLLPTLTANNEFRQQLLDRSYPQLRDSLRAELAKTSC